MKCFREQFNECRGNGNAYDSKCDKKIPSLHDGIIHQTTEILCKKYGVPCSSNVCLNERLTEKSSFFSSEHNEIDDYLTEIMAKLIKMESTIDKFIEKQT